MEGDVFYFTECQKKSDSLIEKANQELTSETKHTQHSNTLRQSWHGVAGEARGRSTGRGRKKQSSADGILVSKRKGQDQEQGEDEGLT